MYLSKKELAHTITGMRKQIEAIDVELRRIGPGRVICRKRNNRLVYSELTAKKEHGITRDNERIHQLIRKEYLRQHLKALKENLTAIERCYNHYTDIIPENVAAKVTCKHPNLPVKFMLSPTDDLWASAPYEKNPFYEEDLQYYTTGGIIVRSKSERDIANALEEAGIPYRYDVKIQCGDAVYYADFVIKRPDGSIVIWEHFGREHDKAYMAKNRVRIQDYITLGYRPWDNLIWTLESDMKNLQTIRKIIKRFILTTV